MKPLADCRLYGIVDLGHIPPGAALSLLDAMLAGGADIVQLRAKGAPEALVVDLARRLAPRCRAAGAPFILNDHPHLVGPAGADGVHVGQEDAPVAEARRAAAASLPAGRAGAPILVGKSTHSIVQARAALAEGPDYIAFGPLFATPTKPDYHPVGLADIRAVSSLAGPTPLFCIGGITNGNLRSVLEAGADRVVIVSGILLAPDPEGYARAAAALLARTG